MAKKNTPAIPNELLDQLLAGRDPRTALDSGGLIGDLKKALAERMLNAEMDVHLATEAGRQQDLVSSSNIDRLGRSIRLLAEQFAANPLVVQRMLRLVL
jgi:transposase-like protein